jgi:SAM-dependent methyltransferase
MRVLGECLRNIDIEDEQWLDAGCGSGTLSRYLAGCGGQILGVDASAEMVRNATLRAVEYPDRCLKFRQIDSIAALPISDCSLDGILCSSVLEYVPDVRACLGEFARVLRPGGRLLVSIPNRRSIVRRIQVSTHRLARAMGRNCFPFIEHSRHEFTPYVFRDLMERFGFTTDKIIPFGSPIPQWLQRREFAGSLLMFSAVRRCTGL